MNTSGEWLSQYLTVLVFCVVAGCSNTAQVEDAGETIAADDCPAWTIAVEIDGRIECIDEQILEREREIRELDDDW